MKNTLQLAMFICVFVLAKETCAQSTDERPGQISVLKDIPYAQQLFRVATNGGEEISQHDQIPVLKDLPFVERLFRLSTGEESSMRNRREIPVLSEIPLVSQLYRLESDDRTMDLR